ncbi:uncharacterized protein LOC116168654 isoform X2 [Photinus pyralis]|uniref:uncharacterized protein LOC116168654 isoform X2 n=1 Tax=Photinus pyralis TaxID=7054 RepID=UPI001267655C|nr:uncharacterized protein LOC116168654 isoform X2 [Photinus pyralis]
MPTSITSLLLLSITFLTGESSLLIYKSINGRNYPIAATIKISSGRNVTLKCKDINNANNDVEWRRNSGSFEYIRNDDASRINFIPFRPEDADVYICKSLKYNVSKAVTITLDDSSSTKRRLKRTQYRIDEDGYDFNKIKLNFSDMLGDFFKNGRKFKYTAPSLWNDQTDDRKIKLNFSDKLDDFLKNGRKFKYTEPSLWNDRTDDRSEIWPGYGQPGSNMFTSNIASNNAPHLELEYEELLKRTDYKTVDSSGSVSGTNEYGFLYCIAIIGGLFLFGGIMCMCVRNNPNVRARLERVSSNGPPCTHAMCVRHRDTNPLAGCILPNLNATNRIPAPIVHTDAIGDVTVLSFSEEMIDGFTDYDDNADGRSDIPPSYANSVDEGKTDLPPSYEEALKIMLPSVYCNQETAPARPLN